MINMRTNKVSGIEVDHSAKRHSVELCFGVCVFVSWPSTNSSHEEISATLEQPYQEATT